MSQIQINLERDKLLSSFAIKLLSSHYLHKGETSPQEAFARASEAYCYGDLGLAQRIYDYVSKGWFMFASPILSNAGNSKGLPISCFLTYVDDSIQGLCDHSTEIRWLSVKGGGVGGHWSNVRGMDKITPGTPGWLHTIDADMVAYKQGATRRGSYGAYLDVSHPDIMEFIKLRTPTGDINRKSLNLHHGINVTDAFIVAVDNNDDWELICPHTKEVKETVRAREIWEEILTTRFRTGEPYINYLDEANRHLHPALKKAGLKIHGSNLCNEIHLPTDNDRTAVCCLSSVNIYKYDEWRDTNMVKDLIRFLDNVIQYFIDHAPDELEKARYSAIQERSLGLGAMGFTDYIQSKGLALSDGIAMSVNQGIFRHINTKAIEASEELAKERKEPQLLKGTGRRNAHLMAIAPNANSSIILGVSPCIEPRVSNCYTHKTRVGSHLVKNPELDKLLRKVAIREAERERMGQSIDTARNLYVEGLWKSITKHDGSVQHLECLDDNEKEIFKTAYELDQRILVDMARARQPYICQGQSVNLFFPSGSDRAYVNAVHRRAFRKEGIGNPLKGVYYLRTTSSRSTEKVSLSVQRDALKDGVNEVCLSCEG